jgi:hypothetical protein
MKATYPILALIGGTLVLVPIYFQASSMDLDRFTLAQYIAADTALSRWWAVVAFPFLVGLSFLVAAAACALLRPGRRAATSILIVCFVLAVLLCLVNAPLGVLAAVSSLVLLAGFLRRNPSSFG